MWSCTPGTNRLSQDFCLGVDRECQPCESLSRCGAVRPNRAVFVRAAVWGGYVWHFARSKHSGQGRGYRPIREVVPAVWFPLTSENVVWFPVCSVVVSLQALR